MSPGNLTNIARRAHGNGLLPVAFLPIPKGEYTVSSSRIMGLCQWSLSLARQRHRGKTDYMTFCRQMYHSCLAKIFEPLKAGMTTPELIRCPEGHWRKAIYGLGPYIADYPEQVWLAGIVQGWCPKWVAVQLYWHFSSLFLHPTDVTPSQVTWTSRGHEGDHTRRQISLSNVLIREYCGRITAFVQIFKWVFRLVYKRLACNLTQML